MANASASLSERVRHLEVIAGDQIRPLGVAPFTARPMLFVTPESERFDWVVLPLSEDPAFQSGELGVPQRQRETLQQLDALKVRFDVLLIAHEVAKGHGLPAKPTSFDVQVALQRQQDEPFEEAGAAITRLASIAKAILIGTAALSLAPARGLAIVANPDPILIGALTEDGRAVEGTPAVLFEIVRW